MEQLDLGERADAFAEMPEALARHPCHPSPAERVGMAGCPGFGN